MKSLAFFPGKAGPLPSYLGYLFLRFPGSLGPEETWSLECLDTYDRRWTRQGKVWIRREGTLSLVAPPSLRVLETDTRLFGLQAPVVLGRLTVKVRSVVFTGLGAETRIIKAGSQTVFVLEGPEGEAFEALANALSTDGFVSLSPGQGWWVRDKDPGFCLPPPEEAHPEDPAGPALLARIRDELRLARLYEDGVRADVDTECLHQYRVHLRRIRSLLSSGVWPQAPETPRLQGLIKLLQQKTNTLRDLDVLVLDLPSLRDRVPWGEGAHLDTWQASVTRRRHTEFRKVKAWLRSPEYTGLVEGIGPILADLGEGEPWTVAQWKALALAQAARGLKKRSKALSALSPDDDFHRIRIQAKRLRALLEKAEKDPELRDLVLELRRVQDGLGRFQDHCVRLEGLKRELVAARAGEATADPLAFGLLLGTLASDHPSQRAQALACVQRLGRRRLRKALDRMGSGESRHGS